MSSQHRQTNSNGYFGSKNGLMFGIKISDIHIQIRLRFGRLNSINFSNKSIN